MTARRGFWLRCAAALLLLVAAAVVGPLLDSYLLTIAGTIGIYMLFAIGYNLLLGAAGQFDFGQGAFLCIGAYTVGVLQARYALPPGLALLAGGVVSVLFGLAIGVIVLRLEGFYLALVTLGFQQTVVLGVSLWGPVTGGFQGMSVDTPHLGGLSGGLSLFFIVAVLDAVMVVAAGNLLRSRVGRNFLAIRDSEIAARAMGIDLVRTRIMAYGLSAFYGGIAGGLMAWLLSYITPVGFGIAETLKVLTMITVGGLGSVAGAVVGAASMVVLGELLRESRLFVEIGDGLLLIFFMLAMPNGIVGLVGRLRGMRVGSPVRLKLLGR